MKKLQLLGSRLPVTKLQQELEANPALWDANTLRTAHPDSPHHGLSDIWARYAPPGVDSSLPHTAIWYPAATAALPSLQPICERILCAVGGSVLGGVLITRIPPGGECRPHIDKGWHAGHYEKFAVQVKSAPGQTFNVEELSLETSPGDLYTFDNSYLHWVLNPTAHERITLIVCIRRET